MRSVVTWFVTADRRPAGMAASAIHRSRSGSGRGLHVVRRQRDIAAAEWQPSRRPRAASPEPAAASTSTPRSTNTPAIHISRCCDSPIARSMRSG